MAQHLVGQIMRDVPQGFEHHRHRQESEFLDRFPVGTLYHYGNEKLPTLDEAYLQLGTLGGGNHFIELQEDEQGYLGIMVHTGSRNVGFKVANYFNRLAKGLNRAMASPVPPEYDLAYLPLDTKEAAGYLDWMGFALEFARHNRERIMERVKDLVLSGLKRLRLKARNAPVFAFGSSRWAWTAKSPRSHCRAGSSATRSCRMRRVSKAPRPRLLSGPR